jgi:hypothetical protein
MTQHDGGTAGQVNTIDVQDQFGRMLFMASSLQL